MPPVVPPFVAGLVVAPLAKLLLKPVVRGVVKTSVGLVLEVKKAAHEAGENIHDLAAEVAAEMGSDRSATDDGAAHEGNGHRPGGAGASHGGKSERIAVEGGAGDEKAAKGRTGTVAGKSH
ncbi:hypothetical protein BU198_12280 [Streptomyces sp. CBMA156]|nr:hypothetical protein [Streptomyces sp. CBMA156]